jgi:hypothetical protein
MDYFSAALQVCLEWLIVAVFGERLDRLFEFVLIGQQIEPLADEFDLGFQSLDFALE